jgi:hypothetical protein
MNEYKDPTAHAAEQTVATGCAAAGVTMPTGAGQLPLLSAQQRITFDEG